MADRFWRGGAGTWNTTLTTNWATTSGAASGGASVPTASDNVFFDQAGTYTVTMTGALLCANITVSAGTVTFATGTAPTLAVSGSMSLVAATSWNSTGTVTFNATSSQSISNNAVNMDCPITFNGVGGTWTLGSNFAYGKTAIRAMNLTNGTLDSSNYTITSLFASTISSATNSNSLLNMNTVLATTLTSGTLSASGTFGAFIFTAGTINLSAAMTTNAFTFTAGALNLNNFTFTCSTFSATGATTRSIAFGTSSITVNYSGVTATIWNQGTIGTFTYTGTPTVNITSTATNTVTYTVTPGAATETNALNFNFLSGSYNLAFLNTASNACRNINFTGLSGVWDGTGTNSGFGTGFAGTWNAFVACTIYGGITLSSNMIISASAVTMTFVSTIAGINQYFCTNGKTFTTTSFVFNGNWSSDVAYNTFYFLGYYNATSTYVRTSCMATTGAGTITCNGGTFDGYNVASPLVPGTSNVISGSTGIANFQNWATLTNFSLTTGAFIFSTTVSPMSESGDTGFNRNRVGNFTFVSGNLNINGAFQCGTFTHTAGQISINDKMVTGAYTFTSGILGLSGSGVLQVPSMAASGATTRSLDFGSGYIICLGTWDQTTIGTLSVSGSRSVYIPGGTKTIATGAPTAAQALDFYFYDGTGTLTFSSLVTRTLDFTGKTIYSLTGIPFAGNTTYSGFTGTVAATPASTVHGNLTLKSGMTLTESANTLTLGGGNSGIISRTLTTSGISLPFPFTMGANSATVTFQDALTMGATVARALTITGGTINLNQKSITAGVAGSTMTFALSASSCQFYNMWKNTTIPITVNSSGDLYFFANMANPELITHWSNGSYAIGTVTLNTYGGPSFTHTQGAIHFPADFWLEPTVTYTWTAGQLYIQSDGSTTLPGKELVVGRMSASGTGNRGIIFGSTGQITTLGTGTVWDQTIIGGSFSRSGTSRINITNYLNILNSTQVSQTVVPGVAIITNALNFNFYGANGFTGPLTFLATATHTVEDVIFNSSWVGTWAATSACTIFGKFTLSSGVTLTSSASVMTFGSTVSETFTSAGKTIPFPITFSGVGGTWILQDALTVGSTLTTTLNNGTLNLNDYQLTTGLFSSTSATARTIAFGPTALSGRIVCNYAGATATIFTTATVTNLTITGAYPLVSITSTVNSLASNYTVATGIMTEGNAMNFWVNGNFTLTFLATASYSCKDIDMGYYGSFSGTWAATSTGVIYGNILLSSSMTLTTSASAMTLGGTSGIKTITSNSETIPFPITLNAAGATWKLLDAFTLATNALTFTHTNGTFDLNGSTATVGTYATGAGTKSLLFNSGNLYISGSGATAFNNANPTNYTVGPGSSDGYLFMNSSSAKTFVGGGSTFNCYLVNSGDGALTITGSNSFKTLGTNGASRTITLTAGTTQTITTSGGWAVSGSSGNLNTINSSIAGTLALVARNYAVNDAGYGGHMDYVSLKDINFTPSTTNGSGALPNIWWAGSNSTNLGNNFGVTFTNWNGSKSTSIKAYYISLTSVTSWTIPTDWNSSNNIIHLIGGGGGGAGSRSVGGLGGGTGGGGGGYTKILNYSSAVGTVISTTIGTAGSGGAANFSGVAGGTTVFGTYSAGGGGAGGYGTGGSAGAGSTYNGGRGGLGSNYSGVNGGSGGGGGAGGPFGNGAQGGDNFVTNGGATGGGGNGGGYPGTTSAGGNGWLNNGGGGATTAGTLGTGGGAGPSGAFTFGRAGGSGFDILGFIGGGGGGGGNFGGSGGGPGGAGGNYGAGGAGAGLNAGANPSTFAGGAGAQGVIVIQYYPISLEATGIPGGSKFFAFY